LLSPLILKVRGRTQAIIGRCRGTSPVRCTRPRGSRDEETALATTDVDGR